VDVDAILSRLSGVKSTGRDTWAAKCPAHKDRSPSLTVKALDDRVLLHCFAGCGAIDVLDALGLAWVDLYDKPIAEHRPIRAPFSALDVLRALKGEALVVAIVASDVAEGKPISEQDADRVALACGRITDAIQYIGGL
jgi:hypothetical protein